MQMSRTGRRMIWAGFMVAPALGFGACGTGNTVRDFGLHLQWVVERDCNHPERPATLVEVPWSVNNNSPVPGSRGADGATPLPAPEVRNGMRVTLSRRDTKADIDLYGTALGTARPGEKVRVRAGLGGAVLEGIVRGPGWVELEPAKGAR
jgi:Chaperone for flagella basal body P-ring formation